LAGDRATLPGCLEVTAWTETGVVMGVRHRTMCVEGVQFHPESILSGHGMAMLANFLRYTSGAWVCCPCMSIHVVLPTLTVTPR
jgi:anthranilate/para-aminobenzoate synthase component II